MWTKANFSIDSFGPMMLNDSRVQQRPRVFSHRQSLTGSFWTFTVDAWPLCMKNLCCERPCGFKRWDTKTLEEAACDEFIVKLLSSCGFPFSLKSFPIPYLSHTKTWNGMDEKQLDSLFMCVHIRESFFLPFKSQNTSRNHYGTCMENYPFSKANESMRKSQMTVGSKQGHRCG